MNKKNTEYKIKNPKRYDAWDQTTLKCYKCNESKLYRQCYNHNCKKGACAGWADDSGPYCCECYASLYKELHKIEVDHRHIDCKCDWCKEDV